MICTYLVMIFCIKFSDFVLMRGIFPNFTKKLVNSSSFVLQFYKQVMYDTSIHNPALTQIIYVFKSRIFLFLRTSCQLGCGCNNERMARALNGIRALVKYLTFSDSISY